MATVDLYITDFTYDSTQARENADILKKYLCEFQQMISGGCSFEDAIIAYHGIDLSDEQKEALRVVEKSTYPWLKGHVVGVLADKLEEEQGKSFLEAANLLLHEIGGTEKTSKSSGIHVHLDYEDRNA
jgi:hypothetical protein